MRNVVNMYESVELIEVLFNIFVGTMAEVKLECILFFSLLAYLVCYRGLPKL